MTRPGSAAVSVRSSDAGVKGRPDRRHSSTPSVSRAARSPSEQAGRLVCHDAVRAAAVGDDLGVARQLREPLGQLLDRDRERSGDVPGGVLLYRAHVEHHHIPGLRSSEQLGLVQFLHVRGVVEAEVRDASGVDVRQVHLSDVPQAGVQRGDVVPGSEESERALQEASDAIARLVRG